MPDVLTEPEQAAEAGVQATKSAPPPAPALAAKANDLEAIRTAVTDAAGVSAGLWPRVRARSLWQDSAARYWGSVAALRRRPGRVDAVG